MTKARAKYIIDAKTKSIKTLNGKIAGIKAEIAALKSVK